MSKRILLTASLFGALAVIFGAFGAHSLKQVLSSGSLEIWAKGVEYQFYHVFALLFLAQYAAGDAPMVKWACRFFTLGIIFFSGSLYLLACRDVLHLGFINFIGPVTPVGGLCLILGWLFLFFTALKRK